MQRQRIQRALQQSPWLNSPQQHQLQLKYQVNSIPITDGVTVKYIYGPATVNATHDNVIANLGTLYTETLSTFRFRIQVNGDYNYLQQQRIANQIRALLLASVRSAILWRQVGGNRLQLLFYRKNIAEQVDDFLRRI